MPEVTQEKLETLARHCCTKDGAEVSSPQLLHSCQVGPQEPSHVTHAEQGPQLNLEKKMILCNFVLYYVWYCTALDPLFKLFGWIQLSKQYGTYSRDPRNILLAIFRKGTPLPYQYGTVKIRFL